MLRYILILFLILLPIASFSQVHREVYTTWETFLEHYCEEGEDELLTNDEIERLSLLKEHPINLNATNKDALLQLPFLSEQQIDSLLAYRERKKALLTLGELQFISGWDALSRRFTSLFTYIGDTLKPSFSLTQKLTQGHHVIESRLDIPTYKRKGDIQQSGGYLGNNLKNVTRYHYAYNNQVEYGATLEKDAGEPFAKQGNNPFDHYSFYFKYITERKNHQYLLGDFTLHMGEGLLLGKSAFAGQLGLLKVPSRTAPRVMPHKGTDEHNFFRGIAYVYNHRLFRLTTFASYRSIDAKIENNKATTFYTDGIHRTYTELQHKHTLANATFGVLTEFAFKDILWGVGGYISHYNKEVTPQPKSYNRYAFRGNIASGASLSYTFNQGKRFNFSGELSTDQRLHLAFSQRLHFKATNDLNLSAQLRWFSKRYTAPFAQTINFASRVANEQGLMIGARWRGIKGFNVESYVDLHRFPSTTYRAEKPSHGLKSYLQISKETSSNSTTTLRHTYTLWQQNITGNKQKLAYNGKHRLRLQHAINTQKLNVTGLLEGCITHSQTAEAKHGLTLALRGQYRFNPNFTGTLFGAIFTTDDYASSVYAYEPLLPSMSSFGALYYKGFRVVAQTKYTFQKYFTLGLRYSATHYFNKSSIGSSLQEINSSTKGDINLYLKFNLP